MDNCTTKQCTKCKQHYPATSEYFAIRRANRSGIGTWCRQCHRFNAEERRRAKGKPPAKRAQVRDGLLQCLKCSQWKPANPTFFPEASKHSRGISSTCRDCARIANLERYHANPDNKVRQRESARRRRIRPDVREMERLNATKYRETEAYKLRTQSEEYKEKGRKRSKEERRKNPELVRFRISRWGKNNPDKVRQIKAKRRARKLNAHGTFSSKDIEIQLKAQKGLCWHCGELLGEKYHADHLIPLSRGGSNDPRNIVISCPHCNLSKGDKLLWEWNGKLF